MIKNKKWFASAYVAGALTDIPVALFQNVLDFYQKISGVCKKHNIRPFLPYEMTALHPSYMKAEKKHGKYHPNTTKMVNGVDKLAIRKSDVCIITILEAAVSNGTGIEQEFCRVAEVPVIMMIERPYPSRMVMGNHNNYLAEIKFDSYDDGLKQLHKLMPKIKKQLLLLQ